MKNERKERVETLVKEFSKQELADMLVEFEERMIRAENKISVLQVEVNNGNRDGNDLAMKIFKAYYSVTYRKEYED